jgi:hypothetical protein
MPPSTRCILHHRVRERQLTCYNLAVVVMALISSKEKWIFTAFATLKTLQ